LPKMNRAEIRTELKNRGFDGFLDTDLNRFINWGYFDLARRIRVREIETASPFTLTPGAYRQSLSALSPPAKAIRSVVVTTDGFEHPLTPMDEKPFWRSWAEEGFGVEGSTIATEHQGEPQQYYIYDGALIVMPAPETTRDFLVSGWDRVTELTADSSIYALPMEYEEALLIACQKQCHRRANELERARQAEGDLRVIVEDIINESAFTESELQEQVERDQW
jgi:hypothetical protein